MRHPDRVAAKLLLVLPVPFGTMPFVAAAPSRPPSPALVCAARRPPPLGASAAGAAPGRTFLNEVFLTALAALAALLLSACSGRGGRGAWAGRPAGPRASGPHANSQGPLPSATGRPSRRDAPGGRLHCPREPAAPAGAMALAPCSAGIGQRGRAGRGATPWAGVAAQQAGHVFGCRCCRPPATNWRA